MNNPTPLDASAPTSAFSSSSALGTTKSFSTFNNLKTFGLLAAMTALFLGLGSMFGKNGVVMALGMAVVMNFVGYWFSDKIALAMSHAKEVSASEAPQLHAMVEQLCARADLPKPRLYIIPEMAPNAFATGRDPKHAAVAVTQGITQLLSREELEGVVAHELAHVKHRDILISSVAAVLAGALTHFAQMALWFGGALGGGDDDSPNPLGMAGTLLMLVLAPIAAALIQMAISRSREFEADRLGAEICGHPLWLASALQNLEAGARAVPMNADPAMSHMYIVNPLRGVNFAKLFSTHPATEERVARLQAMASEQAANPFGGR
jgi:heat shock protein HtpX